MGDCVDDLENLLKQWNVFNLHSILKDENITISVLEIINFNDLYELTKKFKLGDKILFEFHIQKWRDHIGKPIMNGNYLDLSNVPTTSRKSNCSSISLSQTTAEENYEANTNITVSHILNQTKNGIRILQSYKKIDHFNEEQRNVLINVIASYYHSHEMHMSLQESHKLESQILELFPNEKLHSYRTDRRGKLYAKYNNLKRNQAFQKENVDPNVELKPLNDIVSEENAKEVIHSLKYDNLDCEEFLKMWKSCSKYRIRNIFDECQSLTDIFKAWPQYKGTQGSKLISIDFEVLNKEYVQIFEWEESVQKVYNLLSKGAYIKDPSVLSIFKHMDLSEAVSNMSLFLMKLTWCLHAYLYPTSKFTRNDKDGKKLLENTL